MTQPGSVVIKSTADLTPDGIAGYVKFLSGVAQFLGAALAVIVPYIDPNSKWAIYVGAAIAVLGLIGTFQLPNAVKPVTVPPPAVNVDPAADAAGPAPMTGVIDPPGSHAVPE